jgi:hypothetical protein
MISSPVLLYSSVPRNIIKLYCSVPKLKDRRRWSEGGSGEWKLIKITRGNLTYIANWSDASLFYLNQDHRAIEELLVLETRLSKRKHSENTNQAKPRTNQINKIIHCLSYISSNILGTCSTNHDKNTRSTRKI